MNGISQTNRPRQKSDYLLEAVDNDIVLYHPGRNKALYLNETASVIWRLCDGSRTLLQVAELLAEAFPELEATIYGEVESTVQKFIEEEAVELV